MKWGETVTTKRIVSNWNVAYAAAHNSICRWPNDTYKSHERCYFPFKFRWNTASAIAAIRNNAIVLIPFAVKLFVYVAQNYYQCVQPILSQHNQIIRSDERMQRSDSFARTEFTSIQFVCKQKEIFTHHKESILCQKKVVTKLKRLRNSSKHKKIACVDII